MTISQIERSEQETNTVTVLEHHGYQIRHDPTMLIMTSGLSAAEPRTCA
jgi:hypothetical protein